jgi:hypothetical protein
MDDDTSVMTPPYRLAKVLWEAKSPRTSWAELVDSAAGYPAGDYSSNSASTLVAEQFVLARAVLADGWHL